MNLVNPIAIGNTAEIYQFDDKIVKVFKKHLPPSEHLHEAKKQEYASSCGLPVPEIFEVTEIEGRQAIIMEYVKGKTAGELILGNMESAENYLNICVDMQQKIHALPADACVIGSMTVKLHHQIELAETLNRTQKNFLLKKLGSMIFKPRLCHGDFHPFNLILNDGTVSIIDWVDSSSGDVRADVIRTFLLLSEASVKLAEMYVHIYCRNTGLTRDEIFQWAPIIAAARLSENVSGEQYKRLLEIVTQTM
ncbi:aminoglycoside phosphotransferase family protein [Cytobacillus oceanisediminis]|uniref:phosphotransferase family protein n=1 Tax=Cytobacillus oceanisediminis TaxID=665099 RepID=UPI0023DA7D8B|nr:aminoglycoside phosphotransferase family protein [Cytobacillus oceanisediminis]MDF2036532.1 aminoglycoside phosphotransferase family protein [Cytobacillus oceanisediminis]